MHLDDSSGEILFGSSKSFNNNKAGDYIFLWKSTLDASHNPDPANTFVTRVKKDSIKGAGHIIGIKPTLVSGSMHFLWISEDGEVSYAVYDWTFGKINSS